MHGHRSSDLLCMGCMLHAPCSNTDPLQSPERFTGSCPHPPEPTIDLRTVYYYTDKAGSLVNSNARQADMAAKQHVYKFLQVRQHTAHHSGRRCGQICRQHGGAHVCTYLAWDTH